METKGETMKVALLGASGQAGSEITKELSARGHIVVAVARKPEAIPAPWRLRSAQRIPWRTSDHGMLHPESRQLEAQEHIT